jgi:hypothetical protein
MIKVKIVKDGVKGADDGATVLPYPKNGGPEGDGVYLVSDALAEVFIEAGEAEEITERKPTATDRVKAKSNKAAQEAAEKAAAEAAAKEAAEKAAAEAAAKEAADKAEAEAAAKGMPGLPGLPKGNGSK